MDGIFLPMSKPTHISSGRFYTVNGNTARLIRILALPHMPEGTEPKFELESYDGSTFLADRDELEISTKKNMKRYHKYKRALDAKN